MGAAMKLVPHWHRDTRMTTDLRRALVTVAPPNPLVAAWRWRYEIALLAGLAAVLTIGITSVGLLPTIAVVTVITLAVPGLPPTRRFVLNRAWCIITAHRVRVGCAEAMIYSSRGKIPIILWTAHQPFGERVLLWCRAGTSIDDFTTNRPLLTSACWAQDVAVLPDIGHPHLVTLDVIRRPPYNITSEPKGNRTTDPPDWSTWPGGEDT
jgi:hypothetical protein